MSNRNEISESIKVLYRMFLVHGGFVTERTARFDNMSRDGFAEELKIRSGCGEYTADIRIIRPDGKILIDVLRREPRIDSAFDWDGARHFIV